MAPQRAEQLCALPDRLEDEVSAELTREPCMETLTRGRTGLTTEITTLIVASFVFLAMHIREVILEKKVTEVRLVKCSDKGAVMSGR